MNIHIRSWLLVMLAAVASVQMVPVQAITVDEERALYKPKWNAKWDEQQSQGYTKGTLNEYYSENTRFTYILRQSHSAVYTSAADPGDFFAVYETQSVQGNSLLLGPVRLPHMNLTPERYLKFWKIEDPAVPFDETKHYSGIYVDHLNYSALFVIYEKSGRGKK